jgi:hypothetical protein
MFFLARKPRNPSYSVYKGQRNDSVDSAVPLYSYSFYLWGPFFAVLSSKLGSFKLRDRTCQRCEQKLNDNVLKIMLLIY